MQQSESCHRNEPTSTLNEWGFRSMRMEKMGEVRVLHSEHLKLCVCLLYIARHGSIWSLQMYWTQVLNSLRFSKHSEFPEGYINNFWQAKAIFKHARVYVDLPRCATVDALRRGGQMESIDLNGVQWNLLTSTDHILLIGDEKGVVC